MSTRAPRPGRSGRAPSLGENDPRIGADARRSTRTDDVGDALELDERNRVRLVPARDLGDVKHKANATVQDQLDTLTAAHNAHMRELRQAKFIGGA